MLFKKKKQIIDDSVKIPPQIVAVWNPGGNNTAPLSYKLAERISKHTTVILAELPCIGIPKLAHENSELKDRNKHIDNMLVEFEQGGEINFNHIVRLSDSFSVCCANAYVNPEMTATDKVEKEETLVNFPVQFINKSRHQGYSTIVFECQGQITTPLTALALKQANIILLHLKDAADVAWALLNIEKLIYNYTDFKAEKFKVVVSDNIEEFKEAFKVIEGIDVVQADNAINLLIKDEKVTEKKKFRLFGNKMAKKKSCEKEVVVEDENNQAI